MSPKNNLPEEGLGDKISFAELAQALRKHIANLTDADEIRNLLGLNEKPESQAVKKLKQLLSEIPPKKGDA